MDRNIFKVSLSPTSLVDNNGKIMFDTGQEVDNYDLYNDDTFGSGALEEDWESDHNKLVGLDEPDKKNDGSSWENPDFLMPSGNYLKKLHNGAVPYTSPSRLNEEELERSNQQLAAAVEELILNSDQDQDAIDPAIVSLRKQAPKSSIFGNLSSSPHLASLYQSQATNNQFSNDPLSSLFGKKIQNGSAQNLWNNDHRVSNNFNIVADNVHLNGGLSDNQSFQDEAILSAMKDGALPHNSRQYDHTTPMVFKAEDLEREMQNESINRVSSPLFGISIPKPIDEQSSDRSLPARSVSPLFGSPSPSTMPIGTPPKHIIMNMMHQLEQQQKEQQNLNASRVSGASGLVTHPPMHPLPGFPHPRFSVFFNRPPTFNSQSITVPSGNVAAVWPPGHPHTLPVTQDVINRLGLRMHSSLHSPLGSPQAFHSLPSRVLNSPNVRRTLLPPPNFAPNPLRSHPAGGIGPQQRTTQSQKFGPGHLHPEHSKYVRMRQQRQGSNRFDRRGSNNQRNQNRDDIVIVGVPGDPYANIMTSKEKDWVIHIQMMALQSDRPEIDDFYYQNYIERRLRDGKLDPNNPNKTPKRLITPSKPNIDNKKYTPVQFTNSLGKLTTSSVYNPRQIIDIVHQGNQEEEAGENHGENRQALSKRLVVYKKIEKAYDHIVVMEELRETMLALYDSNERQAIENELNEKTKLVVELLGFQDDLSLDVVQDSIFQIMKIRKGKKLLTRAMVFLAQNQRFIVLLSIFAHLPILIKRDIKDGILLEMYGVISETLMLLDKTQFLQVLSKLSVFLLTASVRDQVGVSIVCKLLFCGQRFHDSDQHMDEWIKFVKNVSDVIISVANPKAGSRHARPSSPSQILEVFPTDVFQVLAQQCDDQKSLDLLKASYDSLVATDCYPA